VTVGLPRRGTVRCLRSLARLAQQKSTARLNIMAMWVYPKSPVLVTFLMGWFTLAPASLLVGQSLPVALSFNTTGGFCPNGVYATTGWPRGGRPEGLIAWGSFCGGGYADTGSAESEQFLAPTSLQLYLAGYPGRPHLRVALRNVQSGQEFELLPRSVPAESWQLNAFAVPSDWVGKAVRLVAEDHATLPGGWIGFTQPVLPKSSILPSDREARVGFCENGVFGTTSWPGGVRPDGIKTWGSFCGHGDADTGLMDSTPIRSTSYLNIYLAGYPGSPGVDLFVQNLTAGERLPLQISSFPRETWTLYHFPLPARWTGQTIRIVAKDTATGPGGWLAFSEALPNDTILAGARVAARLLALILSSCLILFIPAVAACLIVIPLGIRRPLDLVSVSLMSIGLVGYLAFWVYFLSPFAGKYYSFTVFIGSCSVIVGALKKSFRDSFLLIRSISAPCILVVLAGIFTTSLGYLHGGEDAPVDFPASRFGPPRLAHDNEIPGIFADAVIDGHIPKPLVADWLSSDRPPLQTGVLLYSNPLLPGRRELRYQTVSIILQCLFLGSLWMFLRACRCGKRVICLILSVCAFSGFTFLNTFYTWPKLFPVAFLLAGLSYVLGNRFWSLRSKIRGGAIVGLAFGLALLGHGGSMFAIVGMLAALPLLRRHPTPRWYIGLFAGLLLLYTPWALYQRLYDPPGDRLLKWHLAGAIASRPQESFSHVFFERYGKLSWAEIIRFKAENLKYLAGDLKDITWPSEVLLKHLVDDHPYARSAAGASLRANFFYHWIPCIGPAVLAPMLIPILLAYKRRGRQFIAGASMWMCVVMILLIWCLTMFGPHTTLVHQGTYLSIVLAIAGAYLIFWSAHPVLACILGFLQIAINAGLYIWLSPSAEAAVGVGYGPLNSPLLVLCMLSAASYVAVCSPLRSWTRVFEKVGARGKIPGLAAP